jgi:hypothetical protein
MPSANLPPAVQHIRTGDLTTDRISDNIIGPLNQTLVYLNAHHHANYVNMGSLSAITLTAGTAAPLRIDNVQTWYFMSDVDCYLTYVMSVVDSATVPASLSFQLANGTTGAIIWQGAGSVLKGTVIPSATFPYGQYKLQQGIPYIMQVTAPTSGSVSCMAAMKVSY